METPYTYSLTDFLNNKVNISTLALEINQSDIIQSVKDITATSTQCIILFKGDELPSDDLDTLDAIVDEHTGAYTDNNVPVMPDGRPIVRADTRPLNTQTYFTTSGDYEGVGDGKSMVWDFSNDDDLYTGSEIPSGYKAKEIKMKFNCPVFLKDGAIYFFDAPWGQYMYMDIMVPSGGFYPNPEGQIPAAALGLSGTDMYAQAPSGSDVLFQRYVNRHFTYGDCPMGDELNAEGAAVDALPIGWLLRGLIITPNSDNTSKGYASMEMYRCHTILLPGQNTGDLH